MLGEHHRLKCFGLIDADGKTQIELDTFKEESIYALPVAIIENLFLIPNVARIIYQITGVSESFEENTFIVKSIDWLKVNLDWQTKTAKDKIRHFLDSKINDLSKKSDFEINPIEIDIKNILKETTNEWDNVMSEEDSIDKLMRLLKLNRYKHFLGAFAKEIGLQNQNALELRILQNSDKLSEILKDILPKIS